MINGYRGLQALTLDRSFLVQDSIGFYLQKLCVKNVVLSSDLLLGQFAALDSVVLEAVFSSQCKRSDVDVSRLLTKEEMQPNATVIVEGAILSLLKCSYCKKLPIHFNNCHVDSLQLVHHDLSFLTQSESGMIVAFEHEKCLN